MKQFLLPALALTLAPAIAAADGGYFGSTFTYATYSETGIELNPMTLAFRGGKDFNDNFALEGRIGFGVADDDLDILFGGQVFTLDVGIKHYFSAYGKGMLPVNEQLSLYGLLGYSQGKLEVSIPGVGSDSESDGGISYGVGAEYRFTPTTRASVEWLRLIDGSVQGVSYEVDGIGLGLSWDFGD